MNKSGLLYHYMRGLLNNKNNMHIMVNDSCYPIPQVEEKKKQYTARNVKRADSARWLQNITGQPVKWILHAVDNNILQNIPILWEDIGMAEEIYGPSVPHFQDKTVHHKI